MKQRKRNRLIDFNYSQDGWYFVTICTKGHKHWFGRIVNETIVLNKVGDVVEKQWLWLALQYPYVYLDCYVVMPNHFHGIICINREFVGTGLDLSLQAILPLPNIIGAFKTTSSKQIHLLGHNQFRWQRSYYDHIIRTEQSLQKIRTYIADNPGKWQLDQYY